MANHEIEIKEIRMNGVKATFIHPTPEYNNGISATKLHLPYDEEQSSTNIDLSIVQAVKHRENGALKSGDVFKLIILEHPYWFLIISWLQDGNTVPQEMINHEWHRLKKTADYVLSAYEETPTAISDYPDVALNELLNTQMANMIILEHISNIVSQDAITRLVKDPWMFDSFTNTRPMVDAYMRRILDMVYESFSRVRETFLFWRTLTEYVMNGPLRLSIILAPKERREMYEIGTISQADIIGYRGEEYINEMGKPVRDMRIIANPDANGPYDRFALKATRPKIALAAKMNVVYMGLNPAKSSGIDPWVEEIDPIKANYTTDVLYLVRDEHQRELVVGGGTDGIHNTRSYDRYQVTPRRVRKIATAVNEDPTAGLQTIFEQEENSGQLTPADDTTFFELHVGVKNK